MQLKDAIKDTNGQLKILIKRIPMVYFESIVTTIFILFLPIGYPIAVLIRVFKK